MVAGGVNWTMAAGRACPPPVPAAGQRVPHWTDWSAAGGAGAGERTERERLGIITASEAAGQICGGRAGPAVLLAAAGPAEPALPATQPATSLTNPLHGQTDTTLPDKRTFNQFVYKLIWCNLTFAAARRSSGGWWSEIKTTSEANLTSTWALVKTQTKQRNWGIISYFLYNPNLDTSCKCCLACMIA